MEAVRVALEAVTLETVTLDAFIACAVRGDLRRLDGEASEAELAEAWSRLYAEFAKRSGSSSGSEGYARALRRRVSVLTLKLALGRMALGLPGDMGSALLKRAGYGAQNAQSAEGALKRDAIALGDATAALEQAERAQPGEEGKAGEAGFTKWIALVGKFAGYRIDRKCTTVSEFLELNSLMVEESKMLSSIYKKHGK